MTDPVVFADVEAAAQRIAGSVHRTPSSRPGRSMRSRGVAFTSSAKTCSAPAHSRYAAR